jgi:hypothetical protein
LPDSLNCYITGDSVTIIGNPWDLIKNYNIFYGWNTEQDGSGTTYHCGDTLTMEDSNVTLYAFWINPLKIQSSDIEAFDYFGYSVSISGDYAIIGAYREDTAGTYAGAAYIFHRTGVNTWDSGVKIQSSDIEADDYFGLSVSISGDYAVIGACGEDTGGTTAGATYIFHRTGVNTWDSGVKILSSDIQSGDYFGWSVSISGDYAVIGAPQEDTGGSNAGAAYIFRRTGVNTWDSGIKIQSSDIQAGDQFGHSIAISGDHSVVGAKYGNASGTYTGAAYIFHRTGENTWDSGVKILSSDIQAGDYFGWSVAISGDYAVIGAPQEDTGGSDAGSAYIFRRTGVNTWDSGTKNQSLDIEAGDQFGYSVSISGDYAAIGASYEDTGGADAGAAYIFRRTGENTWDSGVKIQSIDKAANDWFGYSVSISGDYAVGGAYGGGSGVGAAYILKYE